MRLINISAHKAWNPSPSASPREMLLDCHLRIRHFLQLSRTLAQAEGAPLPEISETAQAIRRYFLQALPLHEADEEQTLLPRLQSTTRAGDPLMEAAHLMVEQHQAIQELAPELLSLCESIEQKPLRLPTLVSRLRRVNDALGQILEAHLKLEENVIFPAIDRLPAGQLEEMTAEMAARRRATLAPPPNVGERPPGAAPE